MTTHANPQDGVSGVRRTAQQPVPAAQLAEWVRAGLITQEQADRITAHEGSRAAQLPETQRAGAPARPGALLPEALGYVGGVVILVAAVLLATEFWTELGAAGRLTVVGGATVLMLLAGLAVPRAAGDQGQRLRAVLWAAATGAFAGFVGLLTSDVLELSGDDVALATTTLTAAMALALWWRRPTMLQQFVGLITLSATAAAVVAKISDTDHLPGVGVWVVGLAWFVLATRGTLRPRDLARGLGAGTAVVGALLTLPSDGGIAVALATAVAIAAIAVLTTDLALLAIGAIGLLFALPIAVQTWFGGAFAAPVALLGTGLALVMAALWIARRKHEDALAARSATRRT